MVNIEQIKKDCFWDYDFSDDEIRALALSDDESKRNFLFQKILLNSTNLFNDLKIFDINTLSYLLENYKVPKFNHDYIFRRKNLVEVYFFDKPLLIEELKWVA
jgi:hypothetical protein